MKKLISAVSAICLIATISVTPVFAHGHSNGTATSKYSVCTVENCTLSGVHTHNNQSYNGHYNGDGHDYHGICNVADCTLTGYHEHEGTYCFGHSANDGHNYHNTGGSHRQGGRHH